MYCTRVRSVRSLQGFRGILFLLTASACCATVAGLTTDKAIMGTFINSLWTKISGLLTGRNSPTYTFPDTLEGFGYHFNTKGELVDKDGGRFQFVVRKDDSAYNQQRYVALGELVTEHLYNLMETELEMERVTVPIDAKKEEPQSFIFRSKDAAVNKKLMVLIHGSGAVRAGQWTRRLIINENIDTGSQLPYIRRAIADGFGVIVMNTNLNKAVVNGKPQKIRGNENPEAHGVYVWQHFVKPSRAENIAIVAHSYGGIVTYRVAEKFLREFQKRVFSIVFTDSVHADGRALWSKAVKDFIKERAVNYVSADVPLDYLLSSSPDDCTLVSAGTDEHERTSHSCIESAFKFIRDNYATWTKNGTRAPHHFLSSPPDKSRFQSEL